MSEPWGKQVSDGASNAQKMWCRLGHIAGVLGSMYHNLPSAIPLDDTKLLILLSKCAEDCYDFTFKEDLALWVDLKEHSAAYIGHFLYGLYEIKKGPHRGKTILAIRGTETDGNIISVVQDIEICVKIFQSSDANEPNANSALNIGIEEGIAVTTRLKPDYICGHSLGGFLSEIIASKLRIEGASFNCPGPYAFQEGKNLCGNNFNGLRFETILTRLDPVSQICVDKLVTPMNSHIGWPKFVDGNSHSNDSELRNKLNSV